MNVSRYNVHPDQLKNTVDALDSTDTQASWCVRAVYTRHPDNPWFFFTGQCAAVTERLDDCVQMYSSIAFVQKIMNATTIEKITNTILTEGLLVHPELPAIRATQENPHFTKLIVPSHATASGLPLLSFTTELAAGNAFFNETALVDYVLSYHISADAYLKQFMGLHPFRNPQDSGKGEVSILITDARAAIRLDNNRVFVFPRKCETRLVGHINGRVIDIRNDEATDIDVTNIRDIELFLIAANGDLIDYISSTAWPHKFKPTALEVIKCEKLFELIGSGESEVCEFKPYVDLASEKAVELAKAVCAFANHRGGTLFIGVTKEGDIVGLARNLAKLGGDSAQNLATYEKKVCNELREMLADTQCFASQVASVAGTQLIVIEVVPSEKTNYLVRGEQSRIAYMRHGATSAKMSPTEIIAKNDSARHPIFGGM